MRQRHEKRKRRELNATARRTALLGPFLFYFDNDESLLAFLKNPILYLEQAAPSPVLLTPTTLRRLRGQCVCGRQGP
ncbi:hypothetical protein AGDE_13716 [Angomonas deanei]|uniref:Uncharacterized protein n=1 Tax=Angomonas deanei TaxID=59799 RepID=A0A7G2C0G2_9TRYP|nr:hypothetical protein AGDE_13716 [Angomonas deanei]CAD2213220.1 hypothetical protein, conserved [Angomonas deanei]|eukprot:EPY21899.1 hypothetical protein AGDE_13716 [Angomonas deanei]